jgi:signal transduction histidine kinase
VRAEVGISAALSAFAVGLLGQIWLRGRVRAELLPLQAISLRLGQLDFDASQPGTSLGLPERRELAPVHAAVDGLMTRLAARIGNEQAFSAHAAHALRTPLAGIDAQLALALREAPPPLAARLQRVRDAAGRLQGVVAALLGLFRAGTGLERVAVDLHALLARLPTASLRVSVEDRPHGSQLQADADLLSAALMNLLDNSQRHGAQHVVVSLSAAQTLRVQDDGPGVTAGRRQQLQAALDGQSYEGQTGLGLMLADRVARAHGGGVRLLPPPEHSTGLTVELTL